MIRYVFKDSPLGFKNTQDADPQEIGEALEKIKGQNQGLLTPHDVVDAARRRNHVLHRHFEWSDKAAAEAHRLDQARAIIRVVRIPHPEDNEDPTRRAYVSINAGREEGTSYRSRDDVINSQRLQLLVIQRAERDLSAWESRYRDLAEACAYVVRAREQLQEKIRRMEQESRSAA